MRVSGSGRAPVAALAVAVLGLGCGRPAGCGAASVAGAETQIRAALARTDRALLSDLDGAGGGTAELSALAFLDPAVSAEGSRATVAAMLDATGRVAWKDQQAELRYLGRERFQMRRCSTAGWCADGDELRRLRGVLAALLRRQQAFASRRPEELAPLVSARYSDRGEDRAAVLARLAREWAAAGDEALAIRGWQVRVERDVADVGEDALVERHGQVRTDVRAVYRLAWEDGGWAFVSGL